MAHVTIEEAFRTQLDLSGNELIVYSLVYGFSQQKNGVFYGSREFIRFWLGCKSLRTVDTTIASLVDKGLIEKSEYYEGQVRRCAYRITSDPCNFCTGANSAHDPCRNCADTGANSAHNSPIDTTIDSPKSISTSRAQEKKLQIAEFVSMTEAEYQKLLDEYGQEDADALVSILDNYKGSSGKRYKSDYRAIKSWCVERLEEQKRRAASAQPRFAYQQTPGPRVNKRGETPTVASMRAAEESFARIAARHAEVPAEEPIDEQNFIDD